MSFSGETYDQGRDRGRLARQLIGVRTLMQDGVWRTLHEIGLHVQGSTAALSARLRDLRKKRFA
jgi:hypothetical protein